MRVKNVEASALAEAPLVREPRRWRRLLDGKCSCIEARSLSARLTVLSFATMVTVAVGCQRPSPSAEPKSVSNSTTSINCAPANLVADELGADWREFAGYIDVCNVVDPSGVHALSIRSVSASRYYASAPNGTETKVLPKPIIFSPAKVELGTLPYSYPDDPPFAVSILFSDWKDARPQTININVQDPTVSGNHALQPLRMDAASGRYVGGGER